MFGCRGGRIPYAGTKILVFTNLILFNVFIICIDAFACGNLCLTQDGMYLLHHCDLSSEGATVVCVYYCEI